MQDRLHFPRLLPIDLEGNDQPRIVDGIAPLGGCLLADICLGRLFNPQARSRRTDRSGFARLLQAHKTVPRGGIAAHEVSAIAVFFEESAAGNLRRGALCAEIHRGTERAAAAAAGQRAALAERASHDRLGAGLRIFVNRYLRLATAEKHNESQKSPGRNLQ